MKKKETNILLFVLIIVLVLVIGIVAVIFIGGKVVNDFLDEHKGDFPTTGCWETKETLNNEDITKKDLEDESGNVVGYLTEKELADDSKKSEYKLEFKIDGYEKSIYEFTAPKGLSKEITLYDDRCQLKNRSTTLSFSTRVNFGVDDDASDEKIDNNRTLYRSMTTDEIVYVLSKSYEKYDDFSIETKDNYLDIKYSNEDDGFKFFTCVRVYLDDCTSVFWMYGAKENKYDDSAEDWIDEFKYTRSEMFDFSDYKDGIFEIKVFEDEASIGYLKEDRNTGKEDISKYELEYELEGYDKVKLEFEFMRGLVGDFRVVSEGVVGITNLSFDVLTIGSMYELMNNSGDDAEKYLLDVKNMSDEEFQNNILRFEQQFGYAEGDRNSERAVMRYIETDEEKGKRYQCLFYEFEGNTLYGVTAYFSKEYEDEEVMELLRTIDFKFD